MNTVTPRVFIAATRQNDGKTTTSLGLIAALQEFYPRIGYIKPVGQRFVEIEEQKIDEDTVLMDSVFRLNCPLVDMSPIAVEPDFTRKYLQAANNEALVKKFTKPSTASRGRRILCCAKVPAMPASVRCSTYPMRKWQKC